MGNHTSQPNLDAMSYNAGYRCLQNLFTEATSPTPYAA